jgi:hypothetical protein
MTDSWSPAAYREDPARSQASLCNVCGEWSGAGAGSFLWVLLSVSYCTSVCVVLYFCLCRIVLLSVSYCISVCVVLYFCPCRIVLLSVSYSTSVCVVLYLSVSYCTCLSFCTSVSYCTSVCVVLYFCLCRIIRIFKAFPDRETDEALGPSNNTDLSEIKGHQGIFLLVFRCYSFILLV